MRGKTYKIVLSGIMLALALVLPFLTGQIPEIGNALCPMHFPVILCGFICGPLYGAVVGLVAPVLRFFLFGMPELFPRGVVMCLELATYGAVSGALYKLLPKKKACIYVALITAMIAGRVVWGLAKAFIYGATNNEFGWMMFISGGFIEAIPGIIIQIVLIPIIVKAVNRKMYSK